MDNASQIHLIKSKCIFCVILSATPYPNVRNLLNASHYMINNLQIISL